MNRRRPIPDAMRQLRSIAMEKLAAVLRLDDGAAYWEKRARRLGARAVFHVGHSEDELEAVTRKQRDEIYPHFSRCLRGDEEVVLDFGCGTGRFTDDLAGMIGGRAVGMDTTAALIDLAPMSDRVCYEVCPEGKIVLADDSVDVVWICLVLGCITNASVLSDTVSEIERVLKDGGLLFLVENTARRLSTPTFAFRPVSEYATLFPGVPLDHLHDYYDLGERISVLAGRRRSG
jgi:SAM-dependent methyltransferase